jgi:hypothetical protein
MAKRNKIIYWIATIWLSLGMLSTGIVQLLQIEKEIAYIMELGYPAYFLILLGTWKILGVVAILLPKLSLLKEWAYAGFFFAMSGAIFSHIAIGNPVSKTLPPLLLLALTLISWHFRPTSRKPILANA